MIEGGRPLSGTVRAAGNKNGALPILAATVLASEPVVLSNVPRIRDVETMVELLADLGADASWTGANEVTVDSSDVSKTELRNLAAELTRGEFLIEGKGQFKEEFVTCGGVKLNEVDFKTMQSRLVDGLLFAGEVLNIDGLTGGFNFQSAWTTGWLAGNTLAG